MFCTIRQPGGEPFAADSRAALTRVLDPVADLGWTAQVGAEIEFFLFADDGDADARRGRWTPARTSTSRRSTRAATSAAARSTTSSSSASR